MLNITSPNYLDADLNDERLTKRLNIILPKIESDLQSSIPEVCQNKGVIKGTYRFFHNPKVHPEKIIEAHLKQLSLEDTEQTLPRFLCLSDSTELDYTGKKGANELGPLSQIKQRGMILHNSILINSKGTPIGITKQDYIIRKDEDFGKSAERDTLPIEQKESVKWLNHFKASQQLCLDHKIEMIYIADREADIMDIYHAREQENMYYIIRSQHNRSLSGTEDKLYEVLKKQPIEGSYELNVVDHETYQARTATIEVRFCSVDLQLKNHRKNRNHLGINRLTAVEAYEINPPPEVKKPIRWVLLTCLPVTNLKDALLIIRYYVLRWLIERFFYLLKSGGAQIEALQMEKPHQLKNAITIYSIAVMNVMKIHYLAKNQPDLSVFEAGITPTECTVLYTYAHKKVDKRILFDPNDPPKVKDFCIVLGRIGGFIPSKNQPLPGLKILSRSLRKFYVLLDAYDAYMSKNF